MVLCGVVGDMRVGRVVAAAAVVSQREPIAVHYCLLFTVAVADCCCCLACVRTMSNSQKLPQ